MKIRELKERLMQENIRSNVYDLAGDGFDEGYCLERMSDGWHYYFRERGTRFDERVFTSEDDAAEYLLARILRDPTTRIRGDS
jgi:hypothetical protein